MTMSIKKEKRLRGENFSEEDKMFIVQFVADNSGVLESKVVNPRINEKKQHLWKILSKKLEARGQYREPSKLKMLYFRLKQHAKTVIGAYRKSLNQTCVEKPTELDWAIADISAADFNEYISESDRTGAVEPQVANGSEEVPDFVDPVTGDTFLLENLLESQLSEAMPSTSRKRMSEFEEEMLKLHEQHMAQKIKNEKEIYTKQLELLSFKIQAKKLKLELLKKQVGQL
ncbi:uncharacterized protein LOC135133805 [Zophobas morio]|uniref:uncharacterized protein LOC135133805 n=1 Tax=Zophobas morio TaxID=2755281 RepID=UPI0030829E5F